jgi:hypothetical protein
VTYEVNPILSEFRETVHLPYRGTPEPVSARRFLAYLDRQENPERSTRDGDWSRAEIDHARKVLQRLVNCS